MLKEVMVQDITKMLNENEEFCKAFVSAEDAASVQKALNDNGMDISLEEVEELYANGSNEIIKNNESGMFEELSEKQLDEIVGGAAGKGAFRTAVTFAASFGWGCAVGVCPFLAAGTPYVVGGLTAWTTAGYLSKK